MSNQPNQGRSNRQKARRAKREAARVPGKGAGQPVPTRSPEGQPRVTSLAELAKTGGGQVPLSLPQLMSQVGSLKVERDFWMNAAVTLEAQVNALTGGGTVPSVEDVAAAEEEGEIQDIPVGVEQTECPGCKVTLGPEAVHAEGCQFEGHEFEGDGSPAQIGANVPATAPVGELTPEEQQVVNEANLILANQQDEAAGGEGSASSRPVPDDQPLPPPASPTVEQVSQLISEKQRLEEALPTGKTLVRPQQEESEEKTPE